LTTSPMSPHERPWSVEGAGEEAQRDVLAAIPPLVPVRVPAELVTEVAARRRVELMPAGEMDPAVLAAGVDALVIDEATYPQLDAAERHALRRSIDTQGMVQIERSGSLVVFVRILEDGELVESRLPKNH
jgi:NADPH-dependent 2,4-dienoyl-CoA reductase/sulfur reductase-like enzyme